MDRDALWPSLRHHHEGLRLAYHSTREVVNIRRLDPGGGKPRLIAPSSFLDSGTQYSPDGSRIAFASSRESTREIWVCNSDGSGARRLTSFSGDSTDSPRWSPAGDQLALSAVVNGNRDVYAVPAAGGQLRRLTREESEEGRPSWSRDGNWIWFRSNRSGRAEIWKVPSAGIGPPRRMTVHGGYEGFESPDGRWLYFAKDRRNAGLWRIPVDGGAEEPVAAGVREGWWAAAENGSTS